MILRWTKQKQVEEQNMLAEERLIAIERAAKELRRRVARLEEEAEAFKIKRLNELRRAGVQC